MRKKIIVTGSLAFDVIMNFNGRFADHILPDKIHALNLSFLVDEMEKTNGGTAGNIAYNLGLLNCNPVLLSTFGRDGEEYKDFLEKNGVDVSASPLSKKYFTSQSFVLTDEADNQIHSFYSGAMTENSNLNFLSESKIKNQKSKIISNFQFQISNLFAVVSPNAPEAMRCFVQECTQHKIPFMYDPGMQLPRLSDEDLRFGIEHTEILIGNDYEIELMRRRMGENLRPSILITTLGEKGAVIFDRRVILRSKATKDPVRGGKQGGSSVVSLPQNDNFAKQLIIKAAKVCKVVDPTGAGDAFRAGFLAGYARGFDLETCGQMGAVCAVYTVEKYGTTTHEFTVKEFCERYEENYGEKIKL